MFKKIVFNIYKYSTNKNISKYLDVKMDYYNTFLCHNYNKFTYNYTIFYKFRNNHTVKYMYNIEIHKLCNTYGILLFNMILVNNLNI